MVVLLSKGNVNYREIGLIEFLWKTIPGLINRRIGAPVIYHDNLHRFKAGRVTGTAYLESKLIQQLTVIREEVLYEVLLDLKKVHNALDKEQCMEILVSYGVGMWKESLLRKYW